MTTLEFSPQKNQPQSDEALQEAASALNSCPYFSVCYFDSEKNQHQLDTVSQLMLKS